MFFWVHNTGKVWKILWRAGDYILLQDFPTFSSNSNHSNLSPPVAYSCTASNPFRALHFFLYWSTNGYEMEKITDGDYSRPQLVNLYTAVLVLTYVR